MVLAMGLRQHHDPVHRLNAHHADELLAVARAFGDHPDAVSARATSMDDSGIGMEIVRRNGSTAQARVPFPSPVSGARRRLAFRALADQAAQQLGDGTKGGGTA